MSRDTILAEIKENMGIIPGFFEGLTDTALRSEWDLFKKYILGGDTSIEPKYRELIGLSTAAARHCWYCSNFHTGLAQLNGATKQQIEEAIYISKIGTGWSTYLNGILYDKDKFLKELAAVGEFMQRRRR